MLTRIAYEPSSRLYHQVSASLMDPNILFTNYQSITWTVVMPSHRWGDRKFLIIYDSSKFWKYFMMITELWST